MSPALQADSLPSEHRKTQLYIDRIFYSFTTIIANKLTDIGVNVQKYTSHSWWGFSFTTSPITQNSFFHCLTHCLFFCFFRLFGIVI